MPQDMGSHAQMHPGSDAPRTPINLYCERLFLVKSENHRDQKLLLLRRMGCPMLSPCIVTTT